MGYTGCGDSNEPIHDLSVATPGVINEAMGVGMGSSSEREGESVDEFHVLSRLTVCFAGAKGSCVSKISVTYTASVGLSITEYQATAFSYRPLLSRMCRDKHNTGCPSYAIVLK